MTLQRDGPQGPSMVHLTGVLPTWLQCLPATKALDIMASQNEIISQVPGFNSLSKEFLITQNCVCTDRYAANLVAEQELAKKMEWKSTHTLCNVHRVSSIEKTMGDVVAGQISGMVAVGMAMRQAGVVKQLREILSQILKEELKIQVGPPKCQALRNLAVSTKFCCSCQ